MPTIVSMYTKKKTWLAVLGFFLLVVLALSLYALFLNDKTNKTKSIYIAPLPSGVDVKYQNALREGISFWEKRDNIIFKETESKSEADITVQWVKEFGGKTLGHTVYADFIEIGLGDSICLHKWKVYDYDTVLDIATHELGHAFGYDDDYDIENSVMYYGLSTKYAIDIEETDAIPAGWARFYPICTKRSSATYTFEVTSSEPIDVYVVPSTEDFELIKKNGKFDHYLNCQENNTRNYKKTCTVSKDSGIVLRNPSILGLGQSAQFSIEIREV